MTRTLNSPVGLPRGEFVYLYEIVHSGGTLRLTNAPQDIVALSVTWTAAGGTITHGGVPETSDRRGSGIELSLFGVTQTIIAAILANNFRGRPVKIYLLHYDPDTGVQDTPDLLIEGRQNSDFRITETRDPTSTTSGGSVTVKTRISADLTEIDQIISVRCSVESHEEMKRRGGFTGGDIADKFFKRVPSLMGVSIHCGSDVIPARVGTGRKVEYYHGQWF